MGDWILFVLCALVGGGLAAAVFGVAGKIPVWLRGLLALVLVALFGLVVLGDVAAKIFGGEYSRASNGYLFGVLVSVVMRVESYVKGRFMGSGLSDKKAGFLSAAGSGLALALISSALGVWSRDLPKEEKPAPQVAQVQPVTEKAAAVESCDCDSGAVCTGPKGGKYCLTKSGNKKYL